MTESKNIPKHWQIKRLGEVCKLRNGYAFKSNHYTADGIPVIRISDINGGVVSANKAVRVLDNIEYMPYLIENNDILIAMSGATTGKFGIYQSKEIAFQNQRVGKFKILDSKILNNSFLYHQINSLKRQIEKDAYGGAQPNISSNKIEQMFIVIPPLPEQLAIVYKIEELFSELDNGKQQLLAAQQQLKVYRQSLLKAAFEGKLTEEWRNTQKQNGNDGLAMAAEPEVNYGSNEGLPEGWILKKFIDIGTWKGGGTPSKLRTDFWKDGLIFWVSPKDMKSQRIVDTIDKITLDAIAHSSAKLIQKGSILFVVRSGILRRTLPIAITICDVTVNQDIQAFTPNKVLPEYIYWYVASKNDDIRKKCSKDGTTVESIETFLLKNYSLPICPLGEQQLIVNELESKLTVCDKIEENIAQSLRQAETLRQSILKKAFEGKLV